MTRTLSTLATVLLALTAAACGGEPEPVPLPVEETPPPAAPADPAATTAATGAPGCWLMRGTPEEAAQRASPRDSASVAFAGGALKVCYGGPSARGRTIIGGQDPYGQPWRMGADEATALHVTVPVQIGTVRLDPGSYSLFGVPGAESWTVVLNRDAERWGIPIGPGVREQDLGEIVLTPESTGEHVETLRYRFEPAGEGRVDLLMEFEMTRVRIPIESASE